MVLLSILTTFSRGRVVPAQVLADDKGPYSSVLALSLGEAYNTLPVSGQDITFLYFDDAAVTDVALAAPNRVFGDATIASTYYSGTGGFRATQLGPQLEAFALDMDALVATLQFTAPILANDSALDLSQITLMAASDGTVSTPSGGAVAAVSLSASSEAYAAASLSRADARLRGSQLLTAPEVPLSGDGDVAVRIRLGREDAWKLQRAAQGLGKSASSTFLSAGSSLGNADSDTSLVGDPMALVEVVSDRGRASTAFQADETRPSLTNYSLDLDEGVLELYFDEPVEYDAINASSISLKTAQGVPYDSVALTDASRVVRTDPHGHYDSCDDAAGNRSA